MFLIDIPFKGCQGRSNRSSIVHAVSYFAYGVNDTACIVHAVSMTHFYFFAYHCCFAYDFHFSKLKHFLKCMRCHAPCMRYQWYRMHHACGINDTAWIFKNSNIFANSNLYSERLYPLNQEPRTDVLMEKTEGWKSRDSVPLTTCLDLVDT
jgi:hypothetical protein